MNKGLLPLLDFMADGHFHSGETIASHLGVTRVAVWKSMQQLQALGLNINAKRGKGYCLDKQIELLSTKKIIQQLPAELKKERLLIETLLSTPSTSNYLFEHSDKKTYCPHFVFAESQSCGRGRRGNRWLSPLASGLYFSVAWRFEHAMNDITLLSLFMGVAIVRALTELGLNKANLKWPNDVLVNNKKLGGVLIDMKGEAGGPINVIIGVGINYDRSDFIGEKLKRQVTDICMQIEKKPSRNAVAASLVKQIYLILKKMNSGETDDLLEEWRRYDCYNNKKIELQLHDKKIKGTVNGVDDQGSLLLKVDGKIRRFTSGEISLSGA